MKKLILMYLLLVTTTTFAESVAQVLFSTNKAVASRNGVERSLARGASLNVGDVIITSAGSLVNIKYINGTLVNIGERSNYKIIAYSPQKSDTQIKAELNTGKIKFKTPGKVKETLKTPVMALAILGTEVAVYVAGTDKVYVAVDEGLVQAEGTMIGAGESFVITPDGIVSAPFPAAGQVNTPNGAEGAIVSQSGAENTPATHDNSPTSTIAAVGQVVDAGQVVSASVVTNNAAAAIIDTGGVVNNLAELSIICLP